VFSPGDFSGDGKPDVLVRAADGKLSLFRGNGTGGWQSTTSTEIGTGWNTYNRVLSTGDFTGDARPDVIGRDPNGDLYLNRGNGTGAWQNGQRTKFGTGWQSFTMIF
jgi:hypothetical protein